MICNRMLLHGVSSPAISLAALGVLVAVGPQSAAAQYASENVSLHRQIDLSTFGASSGNDCWGYTSPSGREYALMGLNNKVAFVEVTSPASASWFASITHASSTWGDIKVYQHVAYIVTEMRSILIRPIFGGCTFAQQRGIAVWQRSWFKLSLNMPSS